MCADPLRAARGCVVGCLLGIASWLLLLLAVLVALALAGCGGGDDEPEPTVPTPGVDCKTRPELCR